jgi:phenylalanyl-tRNA synthetase alpha chain
MDDKYQSEYCNVPLLIKQKIGRNLHNTKNHPINIIKNLIYKYFNSLESYKFDTYDDFQPIVSVEDNFDKLLIKEDHPARKKSDTFYVDKNTVLRTHTSAHQNQLMSKGNYNFLVTGDVYRKDEVNKTHFPIFHQMEGVAVVPEESDPKEELLKVLGGLVEHLFPGCEYRISDDYFPFTDPSFEIEVKYRDEWLEILGCGIVHKEILDNNKCDKKLWAFGLGLERLCMILFDIPDIRYFWSTNDRFLIQFKDEKIKKFIPYSSLPPLYRDIAFWIPDNKVNNKDQDNTWLDENDFFDLIRNIVGDWVENIELKDKFVNPKTNKNSRMYRITYSPMDQTLKDGNDFKEKVNEIQASVIKNVSNILDVEVR